MHSFPFCVMVHHIAQHSHSFYQDISSLRANLTIASAAQDVVDKVRGYVGMRKVTLGRTERHGHLRPLLNDEFVFQIGFLDQARLLPHVCSMLATQHKESLRSAEDDRALLHGQICHLPIALLLDMYIWIIWALLLQGFWPDGVYTAPTDEALESDIKFTKSLGMNLLRKAHKGAYSLLVDSEAKIDQGSFGLGRREASACEMTPQHSPAISWQPRRGWVIVPLPDAKAADMIDMLFRWSGGFPPKAMPRHVENRKGL